MLQRMPDIGQHGTRRDLDLTFLSEHIQQDGDALPSRQHARDEGSDSQKGALDYFDFLPLLDFGSDLHGLSVGHILAKIGDDQFIKNGGMAAEAERLRNATGRGDPAVEFWVDKAGKEIAWEHRLIHPSHAGGSCPLEADFRTEDLDPQLAAEQARRNSLLFRLCFHAIPKQLFREDEGGGVSIGHPVMLPRSLRFGNGWGSGYVTKM